MPAAKQPAAQCRRVLPPVNGIVTAFAGAVRRIVAEASAATE